MKERPVEDHRRGYPQLAALQNSDSTFSIFRRFGNLHVRCLLRAQDELRDLEAQLWQTDADEPVQLYLSSRVHDANAHRQFLLEQIRIKLRVYHKDLLRYCQLDALSRPRTRSVASFRRWMDAVKPLIKEESDFSLHVNDLVTVKQDVESGSLEYAIELISQKTGIARPLLQTKGNKGKTTDNHLHFYSNKRLNIAGRLVHTIVAALMIIVPVILLYLFPHPKARLCTLGIFILVFALFVALLTRAGRHEIFIATATYVQNLEASLSHYVIAVFGGS